MAKILYMYNLVLYNSFFHLGLLVNCPNKIHGRLQKVFINGNGIIIQIIEHLKVILDSFKNGRWTTPLKKSLG